MTNNNRTQKTDSIEFVSTIPYGLAGYAEKAAKTYNRNFQSLPSLVKDHFDLLKTKKDY